MDGTKQGSAGPTLRRPSAIPGGDQHSSPEAAKRLRRARVVDRAMARLIAAGGTLVLVAVLAIFVFIAIEAWPLVRPATLGPVRSTATVAKTPRALAV